MSPSASTLPLSDGAQRAQPHSRQASLRTTGVERYMPNHETQTHRQVRTQEPPPASGKKQNVHYTVFVRLPFTRGDFQDPPLVAWDSIKDEALWKLIYSGSTSKKDISWEAISQRFDVSLPLLLQQAAWLSERHLQSMRRQVLKIGGGGAASPVSQELEHRVAKRGEDESGMGSGGVGMERQGSQGSSNVSYHCRSMLMVA